MVTSSRTSSKWILRAGVWLVLYALILFAAACTIGTGRFVPRITSRAPPLVSLDNSGAGGMESDQNHVTSDDDPLFFMVRGTW